MFKRYAPALVAFAVGCGAQTGVVGETELGIGSQDGDDDASDEPASDESRAQDDGGAQPVSDPRPADTADGGMTARPNGDEEEVTNPPSEAMPGPTVSVSGMSSGDPVTPEPEQDMPPMPIGDVSPTPTEIGTDNPTPPCSDGTEITLPAVEIATRLSRLMFDAAPTQELLERAEAGELSTYGLVECAASEMLQEPEAANGLLAFLNTWLQFESWPFSPNSSLGVGVWTDMKDQAHAYLLQFSSSDDTTLERLLTERQSYVGPQLAMHLGLEDSAELPAMVTVPEQRGVLTLGLITASLRRIGQRGRWVLETLQCVQIPPKPPDLAPPMFPEDEGYQQAYLASLSEPVCTGCHELMDPYGMGLENFDSLGRFQTEEAGAPLLVSGQLYVEDTSASADASFEGLDDFTLKLAESSLVSRCLADTMLFHAAGVEATSADPQTLELERYRLREPFEASGKDLKSLLVAVTQVDSFWN